VATRANALTPMRVDFPSLKALVSVQRMDSVLRGNDRLEDQPMRCVAPLEHRSRGPDEPGNAL